MSSPQPLTIEGAYIKRSQYRSDKRSTFKPVLTTQKIIKYDKRKDFIEDFEKVLSFFMETEEPINLTTLQ